MLRLLALVTLFACSRKRPEFTTRGEVAGMSYIEHMTGGARPDERVPMIIALHAMDGDPAGLLLMLRGYDHRARLILPYGHPSGGMYHWYNAVGEDVSVTPEADRIATAIASLVRARPTIGKPLLTGFSQGGIMTFALALTHPDAIAAAFPISGLLPSSLYPTTSFDAVALPPITAFHGAADLAVPIRAARASIAALASAGFSATLYEYPGLAHETSDAELHALWEQMARVADRLQ